MPRIIVTTDQTERGAAAVLLDEQVQMVHLSTDRGGPLGRPVSGLSL